MKVKVWGGVQPQERFVVKRRSFRNAERFVGYSRREVGRFQPSERWCLGKGRAGYRDDVGKSRTKSKEAKFHSRSLWVEVQQNVSEETF